MAEGDEQREITSSLNKHSTHSDFVWGRFRLDLDFLVVIKTTLFLEILLYTTAMRNRWCTTHTLCELKRGCRKI